jgi:hypothetical protein
MYYVDKLVASNTVISFVMVRRTPVQAYHLFVLYEPTQITAGDLSSDIQTIVHIYLRTEKIVWPSKTNVRQEFPPPQI